MVAFILGTIYNWGVDDYESTQSMGAS